MDGSYVTSYLKVADEFLPAYYAGMEEMTAIATSIRPVSIKDFTKRSAAIHEAAHCVIARKEGQSLKHAKIWNSNGLWFGEYRRKGEIVEITNPAALLAWLRILLAGRRGEHLFSTDPSPHVGLDEFVYFDLHIMMAIIQLGFDPHNSDDFTKVRMTQFAEIDATLISNKDALFKLAGKIERDEYVKGLDIHRILADVSLAGEL